MLIAKDLAGGKPCLEFFSAGRIRGAPGGSLRNEDALISGGSRGFVPQPAVFHFQFRRERVVIGIVPQLRIRRVVIFAVNAPLLDVGEKCLKRIKIFGGNGIEFVIVTFCTAERRPQPGRANHAGAVCAVFGQVFTRLGTAFAGDHIQAVKSSGDQLLLGRLGEKVAGQLLAGELIKGFIVIVGVDHIVPVRENALILITVITHCVAEAHDIQPRYRHAFAKVGGGQQPVHLTFQGIRALVVDIRIHLCRSRRQACQVKVETSQHSGFPRFGRRY